jgi:hypothetical protein
MLDEQLPWPTEGDVLFTEDEKAWSSACLGWSHNDWFGYTEGYRRAAELLLDHVLTNRRDHDTLVYPIVYLSRHYLEIKLKYLLLAASRLLDRDISIRTTHHLTDTWRDLRPLLKEIFGGQDRGELGAVEAVVREFDLRDGQSMRFRYPEDKKGETHQKGPSRVSLVKFRSTMRNVSSFLEACDSAIQEYGGYRAGP